jgi:serine/threonine-protein kinase RsbW
MPNKVVRREVEEIHSADDMSDVIERILAQMIRTGFSAEDLFGMRVALEEAVVNALKYGNRSDPIKTVWVDYHVNPRRATVQIEDEGPGFDPEAIANLSLPECLELASGRGLFLIRYYMTSVCFNERGNRIILCKENSNSHAS